MKSKLIPEDLHHIASRLPSKVAELIKKNGLYLGGGFIRATIAGERPSDIDLFGQDAEKLKLVATQHALASGARAHETPNAITILSPPRLPVQFITRWTFDSAVDLVDSFDFTIARAVIYWVPGESDTGGEWDSVVDDTFYQDLAAKRLRYMYPKREEAAGGSMMRVKKFLSRGYNIQPPSLAGVMSRIFMKIYFESLPGPADERTVADVLKGLLYEVDPLSVIDGIEIAVESDHSPEVEEEEDPAPC